MRHNPFSRIVLVDQDMIRLAVLGVLEYANLLEALTYWWECGQPFWQWRRDQSVVCGECGRMGL
jgi:hypothetical protein